ncbi:MAG: hypothetical protein QOF74_4666 [Caballeronia mineralivorans]|nr:hypothetical protein [Caballeronia mineralivorans]
MNGQRVGYVRVSTFEQNAVRQLDVIELDRTFTEKASVKDTKRPQLDALLTFVRNGDTVVVHSMDRLARNLDDLRHIVQVLTKRGVRIEFAKECLTFTGEDSPMANLMLSVMGAFAEFERALIRERQREGIALAKQRGAYRGRKPALSDAQVADLRRRVDVSSVLSQGLIPQTMRGNTRRRRPLSRRCSRQQPNFSKVPQSHRDVSGIRLRGLARRLQPFRAVQQELVAPSARAKSRRKCSAHLCP